MDWDGGGLHFVGHHPLGGLSAQICTSALGAVACFGISSGLHPLGPSSILAPSSYDEDGQPYFALFLEIPLGGPRIC